LTEHDDVITPLLRGAPRLSLASGPAPARAGPGYATNKSKPKRNVHQSKINGIISLIQKKSNFTAKMFGVESHKNNVSATYSSGTAMAEPVF